MIVSVVSPTHLLEAHKHLGYAVYLNWFPFKTRANAFTTVKIFQTITITWKTFTSLRYLAHTFTMVALLEGASKRFFTDFLQDLPTPGTGGPTFDTTVSSNITGLVGKTVKLTCRVKNLGNRTIVLFDKPHKTESQKSAHRQRYGSSLTHI
uniref:Ig-like domain-containing protein n=1 Tax=Glossina austeni TaxID=7395 RepID=A0A1A9UV16_GLOAU